MAIEELRIVFLLVEVMPSSWRFSRMIIEAAGKELRWDSER
jgi:hypothetical protein